MGSLILEATLPESGAIDRIPVNCGTTGGGRARGQSVMAEVSRGGVRLESRGPDLHFATQDGALPADEPEHPPTPGELLLAEYDAIYEKYQRRVYRQCFRMVRNPDDAEDLMQEVFLLVYRKAHTFRGEANFSTWLHRLTINTVLMKLRSTRRWRESVLSIDVVPGQDHTPGETPSFASSIPAPPSSAVDKIGLEVALAKLSCGYRDVFLLHDREGYRHDEIARILGISEGTSKSQLHKARFRLRQLVEHGGIRAVAVAHRPRAKRHRPKIAATIRAAA